MSIPEAAIVPFGPHLPSVKEGDNALVNQLRGEIDELRRAIATLADRATDGTTITSPTAHYDLTNLDFNSSGHTGFAASTTMNSHINNAELHNNLGDYVLRNPTLVADQIVTQKGNTRVVLTNNLVSAFRAYDGNLEVRDSAFVISNTDGTTARFPPNLMANGEFWLVSRRITSGAGGSTLMLLDDLGNEYRLDQKVPFIRSPTEPTTDGTYGLWIDTGGTADILWWLGDPGTGTAVWQEGPVAS